MRRSHELRHVRCANLVDPNQVRTKIEQSCHDVDHVPALPPLFKGEALGHARESDLEGTNPPLCNLTHACCVGVQQNVQRGCVVWGVLTALDQPWSEARSERRVDTERNSVFLVNHLKEIVHLPNLHDGGVVH